MDLSQSRYSTERMKHAFLACILKTAAFILFSGVSKVLRLKVLEICFSGRDKVYL